MASQELQTKYIQLQMMKQQISSFIEEKNLVDEKVSELVNAINALNELKDVKGGQDMWSSVGGSVFLSSTIKPIDKVLIGVGAGIVLKKPRATAIDILQSRLDDLTKLDKSIISEIHNFSKQMETLESEVEKLAEKEQA